MDTGDIGKHIERQADFRDRLLERLAVPLLSSDELDELRADWNSWCGCCLETRRRIRSLELDSTYENRWSKSTKVILGKHFHHSLKGFQFPGNVWLDPSHESDHEIDFNCHHTENKTIFFGSVYCDNMDVMCEVRFHGCVLYKDLKFSNSTFRQKVFLNYTTIRGKLSFYQSILKSEFYAEGAHFEGEANFFSVFSKKMYHSSKRILLEYQTFKEQNFLRMQDFLGRHSKISPYSEELDLNLT